MHIELLVPIGIFVLGMIVSGKLGALGIQRIVEKQKNTK
jgi:hypothetical protein